MVTKVKIGQSAAKYLSNKTLINSKNKFDDFIKDRGSTTTISNPTNNPKTRDYLALCYLED